MFLAKISVKRPIMTTIIILVFILFGAISYTSLNLEQMPDVEIPYVTVSTIYAGAGPKEIEMLISKKIEDAVSTVSDIERVESYSLEGMSLVMIEFKLNKDVNIANIDVKDKVDQIINDLPTQAKKPIVQKVDFKAFPIVDVVMSSSLDPREMFDIADKRLKDRFSQIKGVARVDITGGQEREIRVNMNNTVVYENAISLPQMIQVLQAQNMNIPGGYFKMDNQEFTVRLEGEFTDPKIISEMQVPTYYGNKKIGQFAQVADTGKEIRQRTIYYDVKNNNRNENVVRLGIVKSTEGNVVEVAKAVRESLPEIQSLLPPGTKLEIVNDYSEFAEASVNDTIGNVELGIVFTAMVLFIFLGDIRSTIIIALSMPASIVSTFMLIKASGMSLNMMSLMGLSVTVGVLVANSVVVIENIFRFRDDLGRNIKDSAMEGTSEVMVAVLASTLTNLVVFLPIANMSSMVGQFLRELALTASFATVFSLFFSFTLTPMFASLILPSKPKKGLLSRLIEKFDSFNIWIYSKTLGLVLKNKIISYAVVFGTIFIFIIVVMSIGPKLGFEFMPVVDDGKIKVSIELPEGYNLDATSKVIQEIENKLKKHKEVKYMLTDLGKNGYTDIGTNIAKMDLQLIDAKDRNIKVMDMVSIFVNELSDIPNAKIKVDKGGDMGADNAPITFYILGQNNEKLEEIKDQVMNELKTVPGLLNLDNSSRSGKPEISVYPDRVKLSEVGLTVYDLAITLRSSIEGMESSKYKVEGEEYDITVTLTDQSTDTPEKIGTIPIVSPSGETFRLAELSTIKFTKGYTKLLHRDKFKAIQFTGSNAADVPLGNVTTLIENKMKNIKFPTGYRFSWGGDVKMMNEMIADFAFAFALAIILTYMLMAAILESFVQPIYIMMTIPLSLIGVIIAMYVMNVAFGITSMMGIIMLIGIVVNNAILMLDFVNELKRDKGMSAKEALLEGCPTKLKPQIMSTVALILGMLPMALGIGEAGKEMRTPMGVVSIGGLMAATVLTLWVIPCLYYIFSRKHKPKVTENIEAIV